MTGREIPDRTLGIEHVRTLGGLLELEGEWCRLFIASGLDIFNAWEWLVPWWRHLAPERALWVLVARDEAGCARGIVPLGLHETRIGLVELRRLAFLGDERVGSDYLDVIAEPGWRPAVLRAVAAYLRMHGREWDLLEWRDMDARSDSPCRLGECLGPNYAVENRPEITCPVQALPAGDSFDEFLSRTRRASNYRRRRRWLERQPGFRIEICEDARAVEEARETFFRLHEMRWAEEGGSAGIPDQRVRDFHVEVTGRLAERGQVLFYTLWVGNEPLASVYALICGDTFYYYQAGMNPAWRSKSVGLVLIGETFADAIRRNLRRYDFLRGEESYKFDWVSESRQLVRWRLYSRAGRGRRACRIDSGIQAGKRQIRSLIGRTAS
ncbi:GNAT family N-acetyltransferase [Wenzhouxiangella sediminis]|uniref:GNAT family N-acetyltransferase n=1 Tax=Wenzhouxiangella sediminis TaxID=1792836 RepID=A0A3E1KAY8_9GAMM|nr:GNAT family N-acetyltransferase [Wenzhouxiangella sediminis]RFF31581.1 GNAT family N-acetyltransferase [Wenzhouxiangella sediminis]